MMKKIKEYELIEGHNRDGLNRIVNDYISKGWQPYGGPCFAGIDSYSSRKILQAVVKYEDKVSAKK